MYVDFYLMPDHNASAGLQVKMPPTFFGSKCMIQIVVTNASKLKPQFMLKKVELVH